DASTATFGPSVDGPALYRRMRDWTVDPPDNCEKRPGHVCDPTFGRRPARDAPAMLPAYSVACGLNQYVGLRMELTEGRMRCASIEELTPSSFCATPMATVRT